MADKETCNTNGCPTTKEMLIMGNASSNGKTLENTFLEIAYKLMFAENDEQLINHFSILMPFAIIGIIVVRWLLGTFPYGKGLEYVDKAKFPFNLILFRTCSAKLAWSLPQTPPLYFPLMIILLTPVPHLLEPTNLAVGLFMILHIIHKLFFFAPKLSKFSQPFPLLAIPPMYIGIGVITLFNTHHLGNVLHFEENVIITSGIGGFGFSLSLVGLAITWKHDDMLVKLRAEGKGYQIPKGALFEYVSCPNYFGEVLQWVGVAIVTRSLLQTCFAIPSSFFLVMRATDSHNFYRKRFAAKFPERKIIFPFLY